MIVSIIVILSTVGSIVFNLLAVRRYRRAAEYWESTAEEWEKTANRWRNMSDSWRERSDEWRRLATLGTRGRL